MVKANWWRPIPALAFLAVTVVLSTTAGTPDDLPGVALGWPLLLHLERSAVLVAGLALVVLIGSRATMGHFPFRLGQIEYAMGRAITDLDHDANAWEERLGEVETAVARLGDPQPEQQI